MEEAEVLLEHLHEHIYHHGQHGRESWISQVAWSIVVSWLAH